VAETPVSALGSSWIRPTRSSRPLRCYRHAATRSKCPTVSRFTYISGLISAKLNPVVCDQVQQMAELTRGSCNFCRPCKKVIPFSVFVRRAKPPSIFSQLRPRRIYNAEDRARTTHARKTRDRILELTASVGFKIKFAA